ncbi:MAG TPA: response regulator, partial [Verrucomicrobiae bacterium]
YEVVEAGSGPAALEALRQRGRKVDLLLADMIMPDGMTGSELAEQVMALHPGTKVILTSGYSNQLEDTSFLLENGILFLPKPYSPQTLCEAIRKSLGGLSAAQPADTPPRDSNAA